MSVIRYFSAEEVTAVHDAAIEHFGGAYGVRDKGLLESALAQSWQTFGGEEFYPTDVEKACRLAYRIIRNSVLVAIVVSAFHVMTSAPSMAERRVALVGVEPGEGLHVVPLLEGKMVDARLMEPLPRSGSMLILYVARGRRPERRPCRPRSDRR